MDKTSPKIKDEHVYKPVFPFIKISCGLDVKSKLIFNSK